MITPEEARVLNYLRRHTTAQAGDLFQSCLPNTPHAWRARVLARLDWLGYVAVYCDGRGEPVAFQLTDRGRA